MRRIRIRHPLETMALDAVIGAIGGGAISGAYGKGVQMVRGSRLRKSGNFRNVKKEGRNFYQDYIQGKYINNVYFGKKGIDETLRWYPQNVKNIPELEYNFKKSVYSGK